MPAGVNPTATNRVVTHCGGVLPGQESSAQSFEHHRKRNYQTALGLLIDELLFPNRLKLPKRAKGGDVFGIDGHLEQEYVSR